MGVMYSYKNMVEQSKAEIGEIVAEVDMYDLLKQEAESESQEVPAETDAQVRRFMDAILTDYWD